MKTQRSELYLIKRKILKTIGSAEIKQEIILILKGVKLEQFRSFTSKVFPEL